MSCNSHTQSPITRYLVLVLTTIALVAPVFADERPNIIVILVDDMGYSDIGCYGGEIRTPNIDRLAANGLRFSQMYNTAKCYPTRASLLTGVYFQRTDREFPNTATIGEVLKPAGYRTLWSGKHHAKFNPVSRGFDHFHGLLGGAQNHFNPGSRAVPGQPEPAFKGDGNHWVIDGREVKDFVPLDSSYYDTDDFTEQALKWLDCYKDEENPFFLYLAYTAPHWPLQAWPGDIAKYEGVYDDGYEAVRKARYQRQVEMGLVDPRTSPLPPMEHSRKAPKWEDLSQQQRQAEAKLMEIYAAMIDRIDQGIGRVLEFLDKTGKLDNTLILFLSDNGACAEYPKVNNVDPEAPMGTVASYPSYGENWATVSNTPLRKWKTTSHEGGIRTPLVVHWPAGIQRQPGWIHEPVHLIDIMPTVVSLAQASYPGASSEADIPPMDGVNLLPLLRGLPLGRNKPLFFEFNKGAAVRDGYWKLVRLGAGVEQWELYSMVTDLTETRDLSSKQPEIVQSMKDAWHAWWKECTGKQYIYQSPNSE